nr:hypothetical protein [Tanacetum cinerariifolium]
LAATPPPPSTTPTTSSNTTETTTSTTADEATKGVFVCGGQQPRGACLLRDSSKRGVPFGFVLLLTDLGVFVRGGRQQQRRVCCRFNN